MTISINWATKVITVPKADMVQVQTNPFEIRELDVDLFRQWLLDKEDDEAGITFAKTHQHNPPTSIGGVTLARVLELINGYTVTFENGTYAVNIVGGNSNIADKTNLNTVSVRAANSAGLTTPVTPEDFWDLVNGVESNLTPREAMRLLTAALAGKISGAPGGPILIRNVGDSKTRINATVDSDGNRTAVTVDGT